MRILFILIGLVGLSLASCSDTAIQSPTSIVDLAVITSETMETEMMQTIQPSLTSTIEISLTPSPTEDLYPRINYFEAYSPNGKFVARMVFVEERIEITTLDGAIFRTISYQGEIPRSDPHRTLALYGWSLDSSTVYFYYSFGFDGGLPTFWKGFDLQGFNVESGLIHSILMDEGWMSFAFSSDEEQIAYARDDDDPRIMFFRRIDSGEVKSVPLSLSRYEEWPHSDDGLYTQVGWIQWSAKDDGIIFITSIGEHLELLHIDTESLIVKSLLNFYYGEYEIEDWFDNGLIQLWNNFEDRVEYLDTKDGTLFLSGTSVPES